MTTKPVFARVAFAVAALAWAGLAETVTNVRGMQRENSKLVDIYYDIEATDGGTYTVAVSLEGYTNDVNAATFSGDVGEGVSPGRNRHILWNAGADWPDKKGYVSAIVTATKEPEKKHGRGVQLWAGGPYWADRNVGASSPEDPGLYFWWGDTVGYRPSGNTFGFNFWYDNSAIYTYGKDNDTLLSEGWIVNNNGTYVLAPSHDAAQVQWGGGWRMPTKQELKDLVYNKCDWTWATQNGVNGYVVRGRGAYVSNSIFLPCASYGFGSSLDGTGSYGRYWSSVSDPGDSRFVRILDLFSSYHETGDAYRYYGQSVRPVQGFAK